MSQKFNPEKVGLKNINNRRDLTLFINEQIRNRCAKTAGERLEILEARDKILKLKRNETENDNEDDSQRGKCMDMCPEKERYQREHFNQYKSFEMRRNETGALVLDHRLMIKEYSRSSADQDLPLPNELRSSEALLETLKYILKEIASQAQHKSEAENGWIADWFDFIWNRTRSIRKDITQQRLNDQKSVQIHEICARFHIYCSHKFCDQPAEVFSFKINNDHLVNCLQSLTEFYDDPTTDSSPNEAEFRAYVILSKLDDGSILTKTQRLKPQIRNSPQVKIALKLCFAYNSRNYVKFFRIILAHNFSYIAACLIHRYIVKMRLEAVKSISVSYFRRQYQFEKICEILCFDSEEDAIFFFDQLSIEIENLDGEKYTKFPPNLRNFNDKILARRSFRLVESKFEGSSQHLCDIIYGAKIRDSNTNYPLHQQSFNSMGYYVANDLPDFEPQQQPQSVLNRRPSPLPFIENVITPSVAPQPPPPAPVNMFKDLINSRPSKFDYIEFIYESIKDEPVYNLLITVCNEVLVDVKQKLNFMFTSILDEVVVKLIREFFEGEFKLVRMLSEIRDSIVLEAISELIREQFVTDKNSLLVNRFLDSYSNQIFESTFKSVLSNAVGSIYNELKYEYLENLYINTYFTELFPQHLNEILQEFIYEDTQFWLNVNSDLASDIQLSIDYSLVKHVFSKWLSKSKKQKLESNNRVERVKTCLFNFVRCESYLVHLSWMTLNYQNLIEKLNKKIGNHKSLLLYKIMFIMPKLNSDNSDVESVKRWLLSKFFQFDRKAFTYTTQYSYYLLNSFLQQFGIKFCIKAYFMDNSVTSEEKIEKEKIKRTYFGTTGVIFILLPFQGINPQQFQEYLNDHRCRLRNIIKLVNENLDEDEIVSKLKFFIISYLNDQQQTLQAIDFILKPKSKNFQATYAKKLAKNVTYCLLDGKVVRDNQAIEENFENFLTHSYINTPKECQSLSVLSFFHIFDLTVLKFSEHINKKSHNMPFNMIIDEYNMRLEKLIKEFLARNEYKKLSWPIPEHTDFTQAWLAKFWNTEEVINDKLFEIQNILTLETISSLSSEHDYKQAKCDILNYLYRIKKQKSESLDECESIYQIESRIAEVFNDFEMNKKEIKWQNFISIVIEFLLTNGCVKFRSRKIHFDQFTIYCNLNELRSFDWINFGERRLDEYERRGTTTITTTESTLAQSTDSSDKENNDDDDEYESSSVNCEGETSYYQINRRAYFNMKTNKRLKTEFDSKIKNFLNAVNKEKTETSTLSDRLKQSVSLNADSEEHAGKKGNDPEQVESEEKFMGAKKLENLLFSLNKESNYLKILDEKLQKCLNKE